MNPTTLTPAPPTDTTVLGRYYLLASTEELEAAAKHIAFELDLRNQRHEVSRLAQERSKARYAEIRDSLEAQFVEPVYDIDQDGGI